MLLSFRLRLHGCPASLTSQPLLLCLFKIHPCVYWLIHAASLPSPAWCLLVLQVQRRTFRQQHDPGNFASIHPSELSCFVYCLQLPHFTVHARASLVHHGAHYRGTRRDCANLFRRSRRTGLNTPFQVLETCANGRVFSKKLHRMLSTRWDLLPPPRPSDD